MQGNSFHIDLVLRCSNMHYFFLLILNMTYLTILFSKLYGGHHGPDRKVVGSNPIHGEVYSIQFM
jgi:hypothetical protein